MATSDLQDRRDERPDGLPGNTDAGHSASIEITSVLQHITSLISDADRRQGEALRELHARLETLGQEARLVRTQVPEAYVPAFERIEDGLTQIADRISRSESERHVIRQANLDLPIAPERTMQAATHEQASVKAPADEPHHAASFDNESDVLQAPLADEHASPAPLRVPAHGSGSSWLARPSM